MQQRLSIQVQGQAVETTTIALKNFANQPGPVLALGAELKSSLCILAEGQATFTEHLGDLASPVNYRRYLAAVDALREILTEKCSTAAPLTIACDLHPDYAASRYARTLAERVIGVQHHHAHIVACMADNELAEAVVGISCDGTGYGEDGTIWGCEVLLCDQADFTRAGHLKTFPLIGGDAAARQTWRPATALLYETMGANFDASALGRIDPQALALMRRQLDAGASMRTSSLGRLFDAAAFLLGLCDYNEQEAQGPIALEAAACQCPAAEPLGWLLETNAAGVIEMDYRPMVRDILAGQASGRAVAELARAFHETLAAMLARCAVTVASGAGVEKVVLSGGCFMNRILTERLEELITQTGLRVYTHQRVPCSDVGIALGQAIVASAKKKKKFTAKERKEKTRDKRANCKTVA